MSFLFGRRKRSVKRKSVKKPPARLIKMCRKHKIKCTRKVKGRRVYKTVSVLKKLLKRKMNKHRKNRKTVKKVKKSRRTVRRRFRFGEAASVTSPVGNYGYNQTVNQAPGVLSQSSQVVTAANNINRPPGFNVDPSQLPIYGVYRPFFTEQVPTQVGPHSIGFMGQPDGSLFPVGGPFSAYSSFGKKGRRKGARRMFGKRKVNRRMFGSAGLWLYGSKQKFGKRKGRGRFGNDRENAKSKEECEGEGIHYTGYTWNGKSCNWSG